MGRFVFRFLRLKNTKKWPNACKSVIYTHFFLLCVGQIVTFFAIVLLLVGFPNPFFTFGNPELRIFGT